MNELEGILKQLLGHKVTLHYTPHEENEMRETSGILRQVTKNMIHLTIYNSYGEKVEFYLNRHACTLHSIADEGKPKGDTKA